MDDLGLSTNKQKKLKGEPRVLHFASLLLFLFSLAASDPERSNKRKEEEEEEEEEEEKGKNWHFRSPSYKREKGRKTRGRVLCASVCVCV